MASNQTSEWVWSEQYQDYYYITYNNGIPHYHWSKQLSQPVAGQSTTSGGSQSYGQSQAIEDIVPDEEKARVSSYIYPQSDAPSAYPSDSTGDGEGKGIAGSYTPGVVPNQRASVGPALISGMPNSGFYETLDPGYILRVDALQFFHIGRVFAMLLPEAATEQAARLGDDDFSIVMYGNTMYSEIRRFVVVAEKRGFCLACPILTYRGRGTTKPGCNPTEHGIIHLEGTDPVRYQGEDAITKYPIAVRPANTAVTMHEASRIRFGKVYQIEWNVKVKDIGEVIPGDLGKLVNYYKDEHYEDDNIIE